MALANFVDSLPEGPYGSNPAWYTDAIWTVEASGEGLSSDIMILLVESQRELHYDVRLGVVRMVIWRIVTVFDLVLDEEISHSGSGGCAHGRRQRLVSMAQQTE